MSEFLQKKKIDCKALDVDSVGKQVKIAFAEFATIDRDKDLILPTAADKSIRERGPQGTNEIWHLLDHYQNSFHALSKFTELGTDGKYLWGVSKYKNSFAWREVAWPIYEAEEFTQHSIGFNTLKSQERDGYREIQEIAVWEGSAVLWGANPNTPTMQIVKAALGLHDQKEDINVRLEHMIKAFKDDKFEDESHKSLMIIQLKHIQQEVWDLQRATQPEEKTTEPVAIHLLETIKSFTQLI